MNAYFNATGNNPSINDFASKFNTYSSQLERSIDQAQGVPAQVDTTIIQNVKANTVNVSTALAQVNDAIQDAVNSTRGALNQAVGISNGAASSAQEAAPIGLRLINDARQYAGQVYGNNGLTCSGLILQIAKAENLTIPDVPIGTPHSTPYWFAHGLGNDFARIYSNEVTLGDIIDDEIDRTINLLPGDIIIGDADTPGGEGHAALFDSVIKINGHSYMIVFDAEKPSVGWCISFTSGDPTKDTGSPCDGFDFLGHSIGQHVAHFQWADYHEVKVFRAKTNK